MHDGMQYDLIQGQGHEPFKVGNPAILNSGLFCHLQWELAFYHGFLNYGTISKFVRARFLIFGLVFVSRDFEVGTNVSCKELTVSPSTGQIFHYNSGIYWCFLLHYVLMETGINRYKIHNLTVS